ncbi:MAG: hypothetical protein IJ489_04320 [Clostridia bacterium]|nr:hypothetical protein [Clostridia bacterium]
MKKRNQSRKRILAVCLVAILLAVACLGTVTLAKYVSETENNKNLAEAGELIFYAAGYEDGGTYYISGDSFTFHLYNYTGDFKTPFDIQYDVSVDNGAQVSLSTGILLGKKASSQKITVENLKSEKFYCVTVTMTSPYEKTISFIISTHQDVVANQYAITDNGNWVQLDLYIGSNPPTDLTISYGALSPDTLNRLMVDWTQNENGNGLLKAENLQKYAHYTLIFFENENSSKQQYVDVARTVISAENTTIIIQEESVSD